MLNFPYWSQQKNLDGTNVTKLAKQGLLNKGDLRTNMNYVINYIIFGLFWAKVYWYQKGQLIGKIIFEKRAGESLKSNVIYHYMHF